MQLVTGSSGREPVVIDSRDVLEDPPGMMAALCRRLEIPFEEAMLSWPAGARESDGVWAKYWYHAVEESTGFQAYRAKQETVPPEMAPILADCQKYYAELYSHRLKPDSQ